MDYEQKAQNLVGYASLVALAARDTACEFSPILRKAERFDMWDELATVLAVWSAFVRIQFDVPEIYQARVESIVLEKLSQRYPNGIAVLNDLQNLVLQRCRDIPDREKRSKLVPFMGGVWLLWNVTNRKLALKDEEVIANNLGDILVTEFGEIWISEFNQLEPHG